MKIRRPVDVYLDLAWRRLISGNGQSEIPDIINLAEIEHAKDELKSKIKTSLHEGDVGPDYVEIIDLPKNSVAVRPIARLSTHDRLIYDTLIFSIAQLIETQLLAGVYSARWGDGRDFWAPVNSWVSMQRSGLRAMQRAPFSLARTDVVSFYEHIDASTLEIDLRSIGARSWIVDRLVTYLGRFQSSSHAWGIPQGPDSSAILANLYLLPVDELVVRAGLEYMRYSDDMLIFDTDHESLRNAVLEVNSILRSRRLTMSATKTKIYDHSEAFGQLEDLEKDAINYGLRIGEEGIQERLYKVFTEATTGTHKDRDIKYSLYRMGLHDDDRAVPWVLENLKGSHHLAVKLLSYLEEFPGRRREFRLSLSKVLTDTAGNRYDHLEQSIFQCATRQRLRSTSIRDAAWRILEDKNKSNLPREFAARYIGRVSTVADGQLLRRLFENEPDPHVRRALLVAMYEAKSVSPRLLESLASSNSRLAIVSRYLLSGPKIPLPR